MNASQLDEEAIFQVARRIADPEPRAAYLGQVCGTDPALRRRVERLLRACEEESFLAAPACTVTVDQPTAAERPGDSVGPYRLMEQIGEGGMGVVYVAEQHQPVRRKVALKVIKPGMNSKAVVARFEAERQALALMDHPNIARVLDAGATESGRPFFVMELVKGIPITEYCDREQLSVPERLELFVLVCRAVQHAHQKGVIHRDLKPSNILVTLHDGVSVPKVIDFGIAKAVGQSLTEKTLYTGFLQLVGTPLYMSPEQADLSGLDVDTRSDVYALGVLLYELLTGTTPFDPSRLRGAALDELRRIIREEEPPRPSTRLSTLGEALTTVTAHRKADARRLDRAVRGELDWVVMKALEKDRRRRYETANDFAADVMRYLSERPVEACPPSARYRFSKYARRNRAGLTTAGLVGLALLAGTAVSTWQAVRAIRAATLAASRERQARDAEAEVNAVAQFFVGDVLGSAARAKARGQDPKISEALDNAEKSLATRFADRPLLEAAVRSSLALTYIEMGRKDLALRSAARSLELRRKYQGPEHAQTLGAIFYHAGLLVDTGQVAEGRRLLEQLLEVERRVLGPEHPATLDTMGNLAVAVGRLGQVAEARRLSEQLLEAKRRIRGPEHPDTLHEMGNAAAWRLEERDFAGARRLIDQLLDVRRLTQGPEHPDTLGTTRQLIQLLGRSGKVEDATTLGEQTLAAHRRVLGPAHHHTLEAMRFIATGLTYQGKYDEARALYDQSLKILRRARGPEDPGTLETMHALSETLYRVGRLDEARVLSEQVLEARRRVLDPDHPETLDAASRLAFILHAQGKGTEAASLMERVVEARWRAPGPKDELTRSLMHTLVEWLTESPDVPPSKHSGALERVRQSIELDPKDEMAWQSLGSLQYRLGDREGCIESLGRHTDAPQNGNFFLAMAHWERGQKDPARRAFDRADTWLRNYERRWEERWKRGAETIPTPTSLRRVRTEAAALMGIDPPEPAEKAPAG